MGVDNGEKTDPDLNLNREYKEIEKAYKEAKLKSVKLDSVTLKQIFFSNLGGVMMQIKQEEPTVLHLGCHAQKGKGIELFRQMVDPHEMLEAIRTWNKIQCEKGSPRSIRIVVLNACESEDHAQVLSQGVDFAIGHRDPLYDDNAINFSHLFYGSLFDGFSLQDSFDLAKSCSKGYLLKFPERDPRQFYLVPPEKRLGKRSTSSQHDAVEGSSSGAKRQKPDQALAQQFGASGGSMRADSKTEEDVATKRPRRQDPHAGGGGAGGGGGQGSGGGCAAFSDSTQQAFPYDVFISHAWDKDDEGRDNHDRAKRLNAGLQHTHTQNAHTKHTHTH